MMKSAWGGAEGRHGGMCSQPAQSRGPRRHRKEWKRRGAERPGPPLPDKAQAGLVAERSQTEVDGPWNPTPWAMRNP